MGTNYYIRGHSNDDSPDWHLGKRSAAGMYCFDCGVTLCKKGEDQIHYTPPGDRGEWWHEQYPKCGKEPVNESLQESTAGKELGFNDEPQKTTGVRSCSSWSWAMSQDRLKYLMENTEEIDNCPCCGRQWQDYPNKLVQDEYGRLFTFHEFQQLIADCPVKFAHSVGVYFS